MIRVYVVFIVLAGLLFGSLSPAKATEIETRQEAGDLYLTIRWANIPKFTVSEKGRELLIKFHQPIDQEPFLQLPLQAPDWISNVQTGYDSVLILTSVDATHRIVRSVNHLQLILHPLSQVEVRAQGEEAVTAAAANEERVRQRQALRVSILQARSMIAEGAFSAARSRLQTIIEANPDYIEPQLILAELETRAGRWRRAVNLYNRITNKVDDPAAVLAKENLLYNQGQHITVTPTWSKQRDSYSQRGVLASGRIFAGPELDMNFEYERRHTSAGQVTNPNSGGQNDIHATEDRLKLTAGFLLPSGQETGLSIHTTGAVTGIGFKMIDEFMKGTNTYEAAWHEPYWGTVEGVVWDGARDRLRVTHQRELIPTLLSLTAATGYNRYFLGSDKMSVSVPVTATLNYTPRLNDGYLSLYYTLDAEYGFGARERINPTTGLTFRPFDIGKREFHTLGFLYAKDISDHLSVEGGLNYTIDRIEWGRGPGVNFGLTYRPLKPWEFGIRIGRTEVSSGAGGATGKVHTGSAFATLHF